MSAESIQVLRDCYAAMARGDLTTLTAAFDEEFEWNMPESLPFGGTHRGHAAVKALFAELGKRVQEFHVEPLEFIDGGDTIVVLVRSRATATAGSWDHTIVYLWRMRNGKAVSLTEFMDTAPVLRAFGQEIASSA